MLAHRQLPNGDAAQTVPAPRGCERAAYWNDTLYATSSADSRFSYLYTINLATGEATEVAPITLAGEPVEAMSALEIVDGVAYTKSNDRYNPTNGIAPQSLYTLDLTTGELTELFDMGVFIVALTRGDAVAHSAVPVASTWALISLVLLLAVFGVQRLGRRHAG